MANERMFLVYAPTGDAVYLGKRMSLGYYGTPEDVSKSIAALFEKAECLARDEGFCQDDFIIAFESEGRNLHIIRKKSPY